MGNVEPVVDVTRTFKRLSKRLWQQLKNKRLPLFLGCNKFDQYIYGKYVGLVIVTDYKPVIFIYKNTKNC